MSVSRPMPVAHPMRPESISNALRSGHCPADLAFDGFLPHELRMVSPTYWSPLSVAKRAAEWIDEVGAKTVVDIGSGAGKFCVASALACRASFVGLEQRDRLVQAATELARTFDVHDRVSFICGALGDSLVPGADLYYLYNPFGENLFGPGERLDEDVELGDERYARDIAHVEALLERAPVGVYLITYNGFGGHVPSAFRQIRFDWKADAFLRMWRKTGGRSNRSRRQSEPEHHLPTALAGHGVPSACTVSNAD